MDEEYWIVVVDDDISNLKIAGSILSANDMRVTALSSGTALLDLIAKGSKPDLILLDVLMPGMDGLQTLEALRRQERGDSGGVSAGAFEKYAGLPVVLLTADDNNETAEKGYRLGALDTIRKPFDPPALVERIKSIVEGSRRMKDMSDRQAKDKLTGLMNKAGIDALLGYELAKDCGTLIKLNIDGFRMINDSYGHDAGDRILSALAVILKSSIAADDAAGRTGGDEFVVYISGISSPDNAVTLVRILNEKLLAEARRMFGDDLNIPIGVSAGAAMTAKGSRPEEMLARADSMLISAKRAGRHSCEVYGSSDRTGAGRRHSEELGKVCALFDEQSVGHRALFTGSETFGAIYRYIMRHIQRYNGSVQKVLITAETDGEISGAELGEVMERLSGLAAGMLRNSDIIYRSSADQLFLLLPMVSDTDLPGIMERISGAWNREDLGKRASLSYVSERVGNAAPELPAIDGLDWRYAKLNLPTERLLRDTVRDLYSSIPKRLGRLGDFCSDIGSPEALRSYRTEIHAMKSATALIGLLQLSGLARLLEGFAAAEDAQSVKLLHGYFVKECEKAYNDIGKAFGFAGENKSRPDGKTMLPALLGVLECSLREMDMESADRVITKIRSYSYDEKTSKSIDRLALAAVELDDSAYDIIKELMQ